MRTSPVFRLLSLAATVAVLALGWHERAIAAELAGRFAALRRQEQRLPGLRAERDRLREQLQAAASAPSGVPAAFPAPEFPPVAAPVEPAAFATEAWAPAKAWKNEGRSTPRATIATLLWAAAGGDLAAMQTVLEFDDATRAKARAWFESLPPAARSFFATPEDMVASLTMRNIPPTTAQLSWFHQTDAEHAIVGVLLVGPASPVPESTPSIESATGSVIVPAADGAPPTLNRQSAGQLAVLSLHRTAAGWRVIVPVAAIDRMAKVLRTPGTN